MTFDEACGPQLCAQCDSLGPHTILPTASGPHYGRLQCLDCGAMFPGWIGKPGASTKRRAAQKKLVTRHGAGRCDLCMRRAEHLPGTQTLEAHHVVEVEDGGSDERDNCWIVCTACHRLIHHQRTYLGHYGQQHDQGEQYD